MISLKGQTFGGRSWAHVRNMKAFVVSLPPTFKIALSKRLMALKNVTLKKFWCELLPNRFRIRKFYENPSLSLQGLVILTSLRPKIYESENDFAITHTKNFLE